MKKFFYSILVILFVISFNISCILLRPDTIPGIIQEKTPEIAVEIPQPPNYIMGTGIFSNPKYNAPSTDALNFIKTQMRKQ